MVMGKTSILCLDIPDDAILVRPQPPEPPIQAGMFGIRIQKVTMYYPKKKDDPEWVLSLVRPHTGMGRVRRRWPA